MLMQFRKRRLKATLKNPLVDKLKEKQYSSIQKIQLNKSANKSEISSDPK